MDYGTSRMMIIFPPDEMDRITNEHMTMMLEKLWSNTEHSMCLMQSTPVENTEFWDYVKSAMSNTNSLDA